MSSNTTWNFPCWQHRDEGPDAARGIRGMVSECGPGSLNGNQQPFQNNLITVIFSFLFRSGWSDFNLIHGLFGIGVAGAFADNPPLAISVGEYGGDFVIRVVSRNTNVGAERYDFRIGDEDGVNWIQEDKWYQVGLSLSPTELSYCVNGSTSPKITKITDAPGASEFHDGTERLFVGHHGANGGSSPSSFNNSWPTCVVGTAAMHANSTNFGSTAVRDRIWDANGDFKNPGEDGSLWFGDVYGATEPSIFLPDGSARFVSGSFAPITWRTQSGGGSGFTTVPGGLKKQYE